MNTTTTTTISNLVGTVIQDGWTIIEELPRPGMVGAEDLTGGHFSIGCIAERDKDNKKEKAFLKVIDVELAAKLFPGNFMAGMKLVSDSYAIECAILKICGSEGLDRIIKVLGFGEMPPQHGGSFPAPYILFEHADGDLRKLISRSAAVEDAWKFRALHDVAVGLQQLHRQKIAHQDLKPSNVLIFNEDGQGAKIGDLGRSSRQGLAAPHDSHAIAGAWAYAPPEQAYGITPERWEDHREGCDLYHLGTLTFFLFAGCVPNDYFRSALDGNILPLAWQGAGKTDYSTALPFFTSALTEFVASVAIDFPDWSRDELSQILLNACNPDFRKRGDPEARARVGQPIGIETFVSRFARLSRRALTNIKR